MFFNGFSVDCRSKLILSLVAFRNAHDQENQSSNQRDETDENHPAGFVSVMESPRSHAKRRQQHSQGPDQSEDSADFGNESQNGINDEHCQKEKPEFRPSGTAVKAEIFLCYDVDEVSDQFRRIL